MDVDAERERIVEEIRELERILGAGSSGDHGQVSESSLDSDSGADSPPEEDMDTTEPLVSEEEKWGEASDGEDEPRDKALPEDPETCLQLNMVYQEVVREKLAEVSLLLAQNREQQEEVTWDLAGSKGPKVKDGKSSASHVYIGHFMKPYFRDRVTGMGPPANEDTREKAAQGVKTFEELLVTKWKGWEKALLRKAVVSGRLQRLLQPKLLKLEYLQQKQSRASCEQERQMLERQTRDAEQEVQTLSQLPEETLLGSRLDSHDWEKISNVNFEGRRSAEEVRKFWQNSEHPSINKQDWSGEEVERLQAIAATHGHLEWQEVAEELGTGRSAFQCLQQFQRHNPALRRRAWTEEEDRVLAQLVQEMRVGSHIPYRRIVYYMEGRDSMQLIYRWTKSLDPSLKRGLWAPEEDAKLLRAVAKYGEQDWFRIRQEVPGRSDAQCRDRYLRRLHFSLKKGRWSAQEEEQLLRLIEKYGVGHWAKIASELPHRSGSQCLSKWKIMTGKRQGPRRCRPRRSVRWSSSSSEGSEDGSGGSSGGSSSSSSSDGEDLEAELVPEETPESGGVQYVVPDVDLWAPARQRASQPPGGAGCWQRHPATFSSLLKGSGTAQGGNRGTSAAAWAHGQETGQAQAPSGTHSTVLGGAQEACPASSEEPASEDGQCLLKVPRESVLRVLRTGMAARRRMLKPRRPPRPGPPQGAGPGSAAGPHLQRLWHGTVQNGQRRRRPLHRRLLECRLLLAVSSWVGDVILPCTRAQSPSTQLTSADSIREQLQGARLASTPVFAIFIQLFQIHTAGCLEVVQERKAPPPPLLPASTRDPPRLLQVPSRAQSTPGCCFPKTLSQEAVKNVTHKGSGGLGSCQAEPTPSRLPPPAPSGPRPKPKTVSELLREKRLREARARRAALRPTALPAQLLVTPVTLRPPLPAASPGPPAPGPAVHSGPQAPVVANPSTSGSWQEIGTSAKDKTPCSLQAPPLTPALLGTKSTTPTASRAPAPSLQQGLPKLSPFLSVAPSPACLSAQPLSLTPVLGTCGAGPPAAADTHLPVTWVLTPQGLLPAPVPAVLSLVQPTGPPAPAGQPVTSGLSCPKQPPADTNMGSELPARTEPLVLPTPSPPWHPVAAGSGAARRTPVPVVASQLDRHKAESPSSHHLPDHSDAGPGVPLGGTPGSLSETQEPQGPLSLERPPPPSMEKGALDLGLLSQESEAATREWLRGQRGVCVPPLGSRLPYQPPALGSLRALSHLLLHKQALEHRASALLASGLVKAQPQPEALQSVLQLVRGHLHDNPAYLLLKARFLAAFTLPAFLATLSPHGVHTTLSAIQEEPESEDENLGELEGRQPGCVVPSPSPVEGALGPCKGPVPSCLDAAADLDVLRTRHALHARKRRRLSGGQGVDSPGLEAHHCPAETPLSETGSRLCRQRARCTVAGPV